jgi:hypothetical protein
MLTLILVASAYLQIDDNQHGEKLDGDAKYPNATLKMKDYEEPIVPSIAAAPKIDESSATFEGQTYIDIIWLGVGIPTGEKCKVFFNSPDDISINLVPREDRVIHVRMLALASASGMGMSQEQEKNMLLDALYETVLYYEGNACKRGYDMKKGEYMIGNSYMERILDSVEISENGGDRIQGLCEIDYFFRIGDVPIVVCFITSKDDKEIDRSFVQSYINSIRPADNHEIRKTVGVGEYRLPADFVPNPAGTIWAVAHNSYFAGVIIQKLPRRIGASREKILSLLGVTVKDAAISDTGAGQVFIRTEDKCGIVLPSEDDSVLLVTYPAWQEPAVDEIRGRWFPDSSEMPDESEKYF